MRRRSFAKVVGIVAGVAVVAGGAVLVAGALDDDEAGPDTTSADPAACEYRDTGNPAVEGIGLPPEFEPGTALPTAATVTLGDTPLEIDLEPDAAPCAVRSLAFLAGAGYFDDTTCHRLTTSDSNKVLQCGDPTGSGSGDPGYEFDSENTDGADYAAGTVGMANGGEGTTGSQFFIVYGDSDFPPNFTVLGHVTSGLDAVEAIAAQGTDDGSTDAGPKTPVTLTSVTTS